MEGKKPIKEIRLGAIKATIWPNDTSNGTRYSVSLCKLYKDSEDNWQETKSFRRDDLLLVAKVSDMAHSVIFELE